MNCWNITSTDESSLLTLKWSASSLTSNVPSVPTTFVFLYVEQQISYESLDAVELTDKFWSETWWFKHSTSDTFDRKTITFLHLHIKEALMKQFVRALPIEKTVLSITFRHFQDCCFKRWKPVCLMIHKFGSSLKMKVS